MPKLTYVVGSAGETRSVDVGDSCSIGSLAGSTIVLDATLGVSRRHCQLLRIQNGYEVADLGSTNGTKVNGQTIKKHKLANGDRIEIGKVVLTFDDGSGAAGDEEISLEEPAGGGGGAAQQAASARPSVSASDQCMLVYAGGEKDGQKIPLDKQRVTFGRSPKNVVPLNDNGASGFHAEISREGGAYVLRDLGSTNGTLVDGEPISETALQHGARIRMGNTRLVFVDPTVSDFEKAMAAVDDLGSEWGMLRAEMDMTRVQQARRSQAVTIAIVLVVVLGGGAFVYANRASIAGGAKPLENVDGNKFVDFSFEDHRGGDWTARPRSPTKSPTPGNPKSGDGEAKQGTAFLAVSRDGPGGSCAAAQSSVNSLITVSPGHAAEFGAWVRCSGGAMGGVRISWIDKPDASGREVGRNASSLTSSSQWQLVKGVAMPPSAARAARIELINAAVGTAFFDDVYFKWGGANEGTVARNDGPIALSATSDAQVTVSRADAKLLVDGAVVGGALRADAVENPSLRGDRAGSQSISGSGGLSAEGTLVDPASGESKSFSVAVEADKGRFVNVKGALPAGTDAAWFATLPDEFFDGGIGVQFEGDFVTAVDPHIFEKVQSVGFGGPHRFKVSPGADCGPLRFVLCKSSEGWAVGFGVSSGKLSISVDTDSAALTAEIDKLKQEAALARNQRKFGVAITKFRQLLGFYPKGSADSETVRRDLQTIEESGKARLDAVEKRAAAGIKFHDAIDLRDLQKDADTLASEYAANEIGDKAAMLSKQAVAAADADRLRADERAAVPLLRKADDFKAHNMLTLAKVFYDEVIQRFPGTDAEKKARENVAGLKK